MNGEKLYGKTFTVTEQHVKLLRAANVTWGDMEWGAPCIDGKRPYGNGDVFGDIARILDLEVDLEDGDQRDDLWAIHSDTKTALQIFLVTGTMQPGVYRASKYGRDWSRADV